MEYGSCVQCSQIHTFHLAGYFNGDQHCVLKISAKKFQFDEFDISEYPILSHGLLKVNSTNQGGT